MGKKKKKKDLLKGKEMPKQGDFTGEN